jgi:hypothetical protein
VDEIVRRVQRIFGDSNQAQISIEDIVDWINDAQRMISRETEILEGQVDLNTSSTKESIELPTDFIRERRVTHLGNKLERTTLGELDNYAYPSDPLLSTTNQANAYYIWGNDLYLYPWPKVNATGTVHLWYTRLPVDVVTVDDVPEIPTRMHAEIVDYCLSIARESNEDWDAANAKLQQFTTRMGRSKDEATATAQSSYPAVRDISSDMWF